MTIGGVFLDAFRTKRRNLYKSREQVLEILSKSCVSRHSVGSPFIRTPPRHTVIS
ncbi:hypothetical protein NIB75_19650 [Bacteroides uniformis]|nr:hypothetical protein [Bacteroides uniformis]